MNDDRLDPETVRREKELAAGPFGIEMAKLPLRYAAAAVFGDLSGSSSEPIVRNGTVSLVDFGNGPMAVTCSHVLDGYRQRVTEDPQTIFKIGDLQLDPLGAIIDESEELDLVTIDLREKKIDEITGGGEIGSYFFHPLDWPPRNIVKGDSVLFGGFPERWRRQEPAGVLQCASFSGRSLVTKVREKKDFVCQFERV